MFNYYLLDMPYDLVLEWEVESLTESLNWRTEKNSLDKQLDLSTAGMMKTSDTYMPPQAEDFTGRVTDFLKLPHDPSTLWFHGTKINNPVLYTPQQFKISDARNKPYYTRNTMLGPHFANNAFTSFKFFTPLGQHGTHQDVLPATSHLRSQPGSMIVGQIKGTPKHYESEKALDKEYSGHAADIVHGYTGRPMRDYEREDMSMIMDYAHELGGAPNLMKAAASRFRKQHIAAGTVPVYRNEMEPGEAAILPHGSNLNWRHTVSPDQMHGIRDIYMGMDAERKKSYSMPASPVYDTPDNPPYTSLKSGEPT